MILIIDNYDSFVYNLFQLIGELGKEPVVYRNDAITLDEIKKLKPEKIVLSPGPGHPANKGDFGICSEIILNITDIPIFGICLGHQGIINYFGGEVVRNTKPMHGKTSRITHSGKDIFEGVTNPLTVMRYHSLVGNETKMPDCLEIIAKSMDDGCIMAVKHRTRKIYGVQFHPESIMTEEGEKIVQNFLRL